MREYVKVCSGIKGKRRVTYCRKQESCEFRFVGSGEGGNGIVMKKREVFPVIRKGMFWSGAVVLSLCAYGIFLAAGGAGWQQGGAADCETALSALHTSCLLLSAGRPLSTLE